MDADGREATRYRSTIGTNWYFDAHKLKLQVMHREGFNVLGMRGRRGHDTRAQIQFAF